MRRDWMLGLAAFATVCAVRGALAAAGEATRIEQQAAPEIAYGGDALQRLDFYPAQGARGPAPLIVFVHGGGWKRGDKSNATGATKIGHFTGAGYAFATIDYRLVPEATVEKQATDVASAVAYLVRDADKLSVDPSRVVLMGHSAGAHLAALVATDPRYLKAVGLGVERVKGAILLDGAAYDVPAQMQDGPRIMQKTYEAAFGRDPARQRALSPTLQAAAPNAPAFLILHVERDDGKRQSEALAGALKAGGARVELRGLPGKGLRGHMTINRSLGDPSYEGTAIVDTWLARTLGRG